MNILHYYRVASLVTANSKRTFLSHPQFYTPEEFRSIVDEAKGDAARTWRASNEGIPSWGDLVTSIILLLTIKFGFSIIQLDAEYIKIHNQKIEEK